MLGNTAHISRLGGDEFSIVIKNKNIEELTKISNEIHILVAQSPTQLDGYEINQTISLGASIWKGETLEALLKVTDQALYKSKGMGRNQVTINE